MSQIVFKEKDYEFLYKSRLVPMVQTTDNPLRADRPKVQVQRGRKQNIQIKTKGNFVDPLNRSGQTPNQAAPPKSDPLSRNPLARPQTVDPLARQAQPQQQQQVAKSVDKQVIKQQQEPEGNLKETDEKKKLNSELSIYWQEMREDFMTSFNIKEYNLEQNVANPFGNQVQSLNVYDGQARSAYSGDSKMEYDKSAPRQQQAVKFILQRVYIQKVQDIRRDLRRNWLNSDKVASLQLAIQSCKLLIDNEKPQFAPIKFVFIVDTLETFGRFVVDRLLRLSYPLYTDQKIAEINLQSVVGSNISETASEIGRNWLIKIGSIRELIPRLYIEATLLKVYFFIDHTQIRPIFNRLIKNVRAIGDYINAMYYAMYLFRIGAELFSGEKDYLLSTLKDFFKYMNQKNRFSKADMTPEQYMQLFEPYLMSTFRMYAQNCSEREFRELFEHFRSSNQNHLVLRKMIDEFEAVNICSLAVELFSIMQGYPQEVKYQMYASFLPKIAKGLTNKAAGAEICELVLQDLMHIKSFPLFLDILASLIELIFRSFQGFQKNQFFFKVLQGFNNLFSLVEKDKYDATKNKDVFIKLHKFIIRIFTDAEDIAEVLQIDTFISCVQYFPLDMKSLVCWDLLNLIINRDPNEKITDPMAVHSILSLAKNLNERRPDSLAEQKDLANMINTFLRRVDFNKDLEQTLNLYADVRANFGNISDISENLINRTIDLIIKAKKYLKGKNQKKVQQFLQACIAYCYITIPTIENHRIKLRCYLQVAQAGLSLGLVSQSEAVFKTAVEQLLELPELINGKPMDELVTPFILELISFMIVFPDDPSGDYLALFQGVLQAIEVLKWNPKNSGVNKLQVYINCLQYLCSQVQERIPYHMENVKSNDTLFNKEAQFSQKIVELVQEIYQKIGSLAQEICKTQIADSLENGHILKIVLHAINRISISLKVTQDNSSSVALLITLAVKKVNDLNKDRTGKTQLQILKPFIVQTLYQIDKQTQINNDENKSHIMKVVDLIK